MGISHFFAYIARMRNIKRWGLMRNTQEENALEHSMMCSYIAHALAMISNRYYGGSKDPAHIMELAAFHEVGEAITGDVATPIKYFNTEITRAFHEIEDIAKDKIFSMLPDELQQDYSPLINHPDKSDWAVVKAADRICAYLKCVEELKAGNMEFEKACNNILDDINQLDMPEVAYFMEKFAPSFSLSLDELN